MNINMSSIMSKAKAFSESPEGKRRMKACLEKYEKEGRTSTGAGGQADNRKDDVGGGVETHPYDEDHCRQLQPSRVCYEAF